jgi:hypothetical protein
VRSIASTHFIFTRKLTGEQVGEPWESLWDGTDDWEFTSAAGDTPEQLYGFWEDTVERSRTRLDAAMARGGLDQLVHVASPEGEHASLRRLLCDLIEEYGRHTGHADLLREAVDGRVGEDPPPGWQTTCSLINVTQPGSCHNRSTCDNQPGTMTKSIGPSPKT